MLHSKERNLDRRLIRVFPAPLITNTFQGKPGRLPNPFRIIKHRNRVPRTILRAKRAADTALNIDFDHLLELGELNSGNDFDAIHGAKDDTRLAAGAAVLVDHGQKPRLFFARRFCGDLRRPRAFSCGVFSHGGMVT